MSRIREGWWLLLVLCVAAGLWFLMMPLLGYGYLVDGIVVRPGWLALPPCAFGAVFAARTTKFSRVGGALAGLTLFAVSFVVGAQFWVMEASQALPCIVLERQSSCDRARAFADQRAEYDPQYELATLRTPLQASTFIRRDDSTRQ